MGNSDCGGDSPLLSCKGIFCHGGDMNETYQSCDKKALLHEFSMTRAKMWR